jgi:hypothetical protein
MAAYGLSHGPSFQEFREAHFVHDLLIEDCQGNIIRRMIPARRQIAEVEITLSITRAWSVPNSCRCEPALR